MRGGLINQNQKSHINLHTLIGGTSTLNKEEDIDSPSNIKEMTLIRPKI